MNNKHDFDIFQMPLPHYGSRKGCEIKAVVAQCNGVPFEKVHEEFNTWKVSTHFFIPQLTAEELQEQHPEYFGDFEFKYPNQVPIIQFVPEQDRAWTVGSSNFADFNNLPGCEKGLNSGIVAVSFHSPGYGNGDMSNPYQFGDFTEAQIETGIHFISQLMEEYNIPKQNFLAHSTISVPRSTTPGPNFPWDKFAEAGIGYLPTPKELDDEFKDECNEKHSGNILKFIQSKLLKFGFNNCSQSEELDENTQQHIHAYAMQFASDLLQDESITVIELLESLYGLEEDIFHGTFDLTHGDINQDAMAS